MDVLLGSLPYYPEESRRDFFSQDYSHLSLTLRSQCFGPPANHFNIHLGFTTVTRWMQTAKSHITFLLSLPARGGLNHTAHRRHTSHCGQIHSFTTKQLIGFYNQTLFCLTPKSKSSHDYSWLYIYVYMKFKRIKSTLLILIHGQEYIMNHCNDYDFQITSTSNY